MAKKTAEGAVKKSKLLVLAGVARYGMMTASYGADKGGLVEGVASLTELSVRTVNRHLAGLVDDGLLKRDGYGAYRVSASTLVLDMAGKQLDIVVAAAKEKAAKQAAKEAKKAEADKKYCSITGEELDEQGLTQMERDMLEHQRQTSFGSFEGFGFGRRPF